MRYIRLAALSFLAMTMAPIPMSAATPGPCAALTPEETWSNASEAFAAEDLVTVASCLAPSVRGQIVGRLLSLVQQMFEMQSLVPADASEEEAKAEEAKAVALAERLNEIQKRQGLPTTAEEAASIDDEERKRIMDSIDYPVMISDLILLIEAFDDESEDPHLGRSSYFTSGTFGHDLSGVTIDGDEASADASGPVGMVRGDDHWYLMPTR